jgi:bacillithiol synthase
MKQSARVLVPIPMFAFSATRMPWSKVIQLSTNDLAYANQDERLLPFMAHKPDLAGLTAALNIRKNIPTNRELLFERLFIQYKQLGSPKEMFERIELLRKPTTYTITTAHQPLLLGGPFYTIFKAVSAVRLAREMKAAHPSHDFLPIFVIGSEDHDFEEVNHTRVYGKDIVWQTEAGGPVGKLNTFSLSTVIEEVKNLLGTNEQAEPIIKLIEAAYQGHFSFGDAAQALLHALFSPLGMIVIQMNDAEWKRSFTPIMERELFGQVSEPLVQQTQNKLAELGLKPQAFVRPINLFYMTDQLRARIEHTGDRFDIVGTDLSFSESEMRLMLHTNPERISPNVVMRPLFQEHILPNLAYVGGGGEIAYWLERKSQFEAFDIPFPVLFRRCSALILQPAEEKKIAKFGLSVNDFFQTEHELRRQFLGHLEGELLSLSDQIAQNDAIFDQIAEKAAALDPTLKKAVLADGARQKSVIQQWEARLIKNLKTKHDTNLAQLVNVQQKLFPAGGLQERQDSFLPALVSWGIDWPEQLVALLNPLEPGMLVIKKHQ